MTGLAGTTTRPGPPVDEPLPIALAVDGGNSKTEALLVRADGDVLGEARGAGFRPQIDGIDAAMVVLGDIVEALLRERQPIDLIAAYLAGADLPSEEAALHQRLNSTGWAARVTVGNDTLAVLRSGSPERWGVAVVCGAGINAIGVSPDGRTARFPALGEITGDWGGGDGLARTALWSAVRGEDGRGRATALSARIAELFNEPTALDVGLALHTARMTWRQLRPVTPLIFELAAGGDDVAGEIVERLAGEVTAMAAVLIDRLALAAIDVPLVLGGGVLAAGHERLERAIADQLAARSLRVSLRTPTIRPIYGAALLALEDLGAAPEAEAELLGRATGPAAARR
jgi:N-acetylglucosamine kinase-like BadF-type ATPase